MYIHEMPYTERNELCQLLDYRNKYEELGVKHMQYDWKTIQSLSKELYRGKSPTDELLTLWSQQNHTVTELFILLSRMKHYQAMTVIKDLIDKKYHHLIKEGDQNLNNLIRDLKLNEVESKNEIKILNLDLNNREGGENKILNITRDNNESIINNGAIQPINRSPLPHTRHIRLAPPTSSSTISQLVESAIPQIPYDDLRLSTQNWAESTILGKGGFGTVFKGTWKCTQVAIKRIEQKENNPESYNEQMKQSITELYCLNAYRHDNILPLYGYSIGGPQPCLVYQFMSGGCLENRLRTRSGANPLDWPTRLSIAIGTARGLQFLHTIGEKPLIHGDIKPANILLDPNDTPRIGDFGLAREGPQSNYTHIKVSRIHGTRPYLPDEFLRAKKFSTKVDTYSFGIVLFEIATGLGAYSDKRRRKFLKDHVVEFEGDIIELKDQKVEGGETQFRGILEIGKMCVKERPKDRPEMVAVLLQLEAVIV